MRARFAPVTGGVDVQATRSARRRCGGAGGSSRDSVEVDDEFLEDERSVEDEALAEDEPEDMTADLESQAADYLAGNDVWMYGPNAAAVLEILDRLEEVDPGRGPAPSPKRGWRSPSRTAITPARRSGSSTRADEETARHLQLVSEAVGTWMAVTAGYPEFVKAEPDWARVCAQTGEAALDAATAVILEESLEEDDFEALVRALVGDDRPAGRGR